MEASAAIQDRSQSTDTVTSITISEVLSELGKLSPDRALNMYEAVLRDAEIMSPKVLLDLVTNLTLLYPQRPKRVSLLLKKLSDHSDPKLAMAARLALIQNQINPY